MTDGYGFHFNQSTLALTQGANDPRREYFRRHGPVKSMVRELGQNSLDARSNFAEGPVRIVFELKTVDATSIPDFDNLSAHILAANEATERLAGPNKDFQKAAQATKQRTVPVLRVSDYNTTGLLGNENDVESPLAALTRTSGVSAKPTGTGGSFGIGAAAGAFNSRLLTVFWTTMAENRPSEVVFAGRADLASHKIAGRNYDATGIFLDRDSKEAFKYLRNSNPFLGFKARTEPGTDTYIPAYVGADRDPDLLSIRNSFAANFFAAFRAGHLEVQGQSGDRVLWSLNQDSIGQVSAELDDVQPFYEALESDPIVGDVEGLGTVRLHVNLSPALTKRHHTALMRKPLMVVDKYEPRIRTNYAAVFICDNDEGNEQLRSLEPPTHDDWVRDDPDFPAGKRIVGALRKFIRDSIHELVATSQGDEIRLDGLKELLPSSLGNSNLDELSISDIPSPDSEDSTVESTTVHGDSSASGLTLRSSSFIKPKVRRPGDSRGSEDALGGNRTRRSGRNRSDGGSKRSTGGEGKGSHSIAGPEVEIEAWFDAKKKCFFVAVAGPAEASGDLMLCAQGDQGAEEAYDLQIRRVVEILPEGELELSFTGNTVNDVSLSKSKKETLLRIETASTRRLRLGVI